MPNDMLHVEECDGGLLRLTLNRPRQHNALSFALLELLRETLESYAQDAALKCVIITGAGDRSFCAGGDLHELDSMRSLDDAREISRIGRRALDAVRYFPVPVAAALNGDALGGGAELASGLRLRPGGRACATGLSASASQPHDRLGRGRGRPGALRQRPRSGAFAQGKTAERG